MKLKIDVQHLRIVSDKRCISKRIPGTTAGHKRKPECKIFFLKQKTSIFPQKYRIYKTIALCFSSFPRHKNSARGQRVLLTAGTNDVPVSPMPHLGGPPGALCGGHCGAPPGSSSREGGVGWGKTHWQRVVRPALRRWGRGGRDAGQGDQVQGVCDLVSPSSFYIHVALLLKIPGF